MNLMSEHEKMFCLTTPFESRRSAVIVATLASLAFLFLGSLAQAAGCSFEAQGGGRVTELADAHTLHLEDGRDISLAGIEPIVGSAKVDSKAALAEIVTGHEVTVRSQDDTPDRYGREPAFVFVQGSDTPVQAALLSKGAALVAADVADRDCEATLTAAETAARRGKRGIWADPTAIKNAESPGDILTGIGRFTVVEGRVLSVRQAGATTYLNFGRNWRRDFAVTIPKRILPAFETAGIVLKSLENQKIRVRGFIETRGGPRIEALRVGQIELLGRD
jgi:endonuclease YncB( thermonuclease family)